MLISSEEILDDIKHVANLLDQNSLSCGEYKKRGRFSLGLLCKRFGKVSNAFRISGLKEHVRLIYQLDKKDILDDIRRVAKYLGSKVLSSKQYKKHGVFNLTTLGNRFGSIANAFREAGLDKYWHISEEDILEDMQRVASTLGQKYLKEDQYAEHGKFHEQIIGRRFGSFHIGCELAGLDQYQPNLKLYTNEQLLALLKKFDHEFGFVPTRRDIEQAKGYPCDKVYYSGYPGESWCSILKRAGLSSSNQFLGRDGRVYDSSQEVQLANILYSNFVAYESHKRVCNDRKWTCDFYLPDKDLWVEYDGLQAYRKRLDLYKTKIQYYRDNDYNFIEVYVQDDILNKCDLYIEAKNPKVQSISFNEANEFLARTHYLGNATRGSKHYGGFVGGKLVAVTCTGYVANPNEHSLAITRISWLDIVRQDKNFGSRFISRVLRAVKRSGYSGKIVSWSDPRYHHGTLYKACNFQLSRSSRKDYVYIDSDGNELHKSVCRVKAGQSESEYAKSMGLVKIEVPSKDKWTITI